jgi:hypothetical protein
MYSDLDERNITELSKFDASVALETLEHYCSGDLSQVRNRRAYLAGGLHGGLEFRYCAFVLAVVCKFGTAMCFVVTAAAFGVFPQEC